MPMLRSSVLGP